MADDGSPGGNPGGYGNLTDAGIELLRRKIGIYQPRSIPPHNVEVSVDGIRHFCYGYGDNNPLYCDPAYAKGTRWGETIAPPNMLYTMGESDCPPLTAEQKQTLKGDPLAGLGSYQAIMAFEWWRPLRLGDRLKQRQALVGVTPKQSEFSGRSVLEARLYGYRNGRDELVAQQAGTWIRAERHASAERKKEYQLPQPYTDEQLAEIDAAYAAEVIRGAQPQYWEDVTVGQQIPGIVRGPLRTTDIITWHVGVGMGITPPGGYRISYLTRRKVPGLFTPNALNVPDTVQRLHWEAAWANSLGIPIPYDYGAIRETFLTNLLTNWIGDDGWLWKLSCQHRRFVYTGDTSWIKGRVTDKRQQDGRNEVHLEVWVENQWGTVTTPGNAVVLLPTRSQPVELPAPPVANIDDLFKAEIERLAPKP